MRTSLFAFIGGVLLASLIGCQCSTCNVPQMPIGDSLSMGGAQVMWGSSDPYASSGGCTDGRCAMGGCGGGCGSGGCAMGGFEPSCGIEPTCGIASVGGGHIGGGGAKNCGKAARMWRGHCEPGAACGGLSCGSSSAGYGGGCGCSDGSCGGGGYDMGGGYQDYGSPECNCAECTGGGQYGGQFSGPMAGGGGCSCAACMGGLGGGRVVAAAHGAMGHFRGCPGGCGGACGAGGGLIGHADHVKHQVASRIAANPHVDQFLQKTARRCENGYCGGGPGPAQGSVNYPYYTLRGPRDFFHPNPPSIGP